MNRPREILLAGAVVVALTLFVTWPQALYLGSRVAVHDDSYFSMWRLAWVAHALATDPRHLFDANTFYPARGVLAFSDAMLLEGVLAAPLLWANATPILVYNLLLLGSFAASGLAMFVLARHLIGATPPALVAAAIFTMAPYRIEHFMHLELQWAMWVPLAFWAIHRAIEGPSWRFGVLAGVLVWLQVMSSIYYGVFLALMLAIFVPMLLAFKPRQLRAALPGLIAGGLLAALLTLPYASIYLDKSRALGSRSRQEIERYSTIPTDYFANPPQNWLWGWTSLEDGPERNVALGLLAITLAAVSLAQKRRRLVVVYGVLALLAIEMSFGLNGRLYPWVSDHVGALRGLRAPARFAIIASCATAMLAALGADVLFRRLSLVGPKIAKGAVAATFILLALDYGNTGMILTNVTYDPPETRTVYKAVRALGPGAVMELPAPAVDMLPGFDPQYAYASIGHWYPLINGYSGYYPQRYFQTLVRMEHFPDDRSIAELRNLGVRYLIFHPRWYVGGEYAFLAERMAQRPELRPYGSFPALGQPAELFLLER